MRPRFALVALLVAALSLTAAAVVAARRARTVARERTADRHLVAARGAAALCELYLDTLAETVRAAALGFQGSGTPEQRLRALYERSEHFRVVSLLDEDGRPLRPPVYDGAAEPATLPATAGAAHRRHPAVAATEIDEHLRNVPLDDARRGGLALSAPFVRAGRGPFVIIASSYQVAGESHATGDPCHPGSRHVIAAEIELDWLAKRLRVATARPHDVLLLDERYRVLGGGPALAQLHGLGPARSPQPVLVELPAQPVAALGEAPSVGALAPVPRTGWSVLAYAPRWRVVPLLSTLVIVWAGVSLLVLLGAAASLASRAAPRPPEPRA